MVHLLSLTRMTQSLMQGSYQVPNIGKSLKVNVNRFPNPIYTLNPYFREEV